MITECRTCHDLTDNICGVCPVCIGKEQRQAEAIRKALNKQHHSPQDGRSGSFGVNDGGGQ